MIIHFISFIFILIITCPIRFLSYPTIHRIGKVLGTVIYHLFPKYRKRTLSNLALASDLHLSEEQIIKIAKSSLQNLMITCLEYAKFSSEKEVSHVVTCENPETAEALMKEGKSVIFFCGHQANWEVLFLEGTQRMPGVAIGRPIKNEKLYRWILSIRQKYGGKIISPKNAIKEGLRGLKNGSFLGIVSDQGMPDSGYSSLFLGKIAWTSPMAALLSHRTGSPIIVATTRREDGKYFIHYSDPIWPNPTSSQAEEIDRLMKMSLAELEKTIKNRPGEWLWSHNRWKQQTPGKLNKSFRHESILIVVPKNQDLISELSVFREIYPTEFLTFYVPKEYKESLSIDGAEIIPYSNEDELFKRDYRFKLVFNLSDNKKIASHFQKLAAFTTISFKEILKDKNSTFSKSLKKIVLRSH